MSDPVSNDIELKASNIFIAFLFLFLKENYVAIMNSKTFSSSRNFLPLLCGILGITSISLYEANLLLK